MFLAYLPRLGDAAPQLFQQMSLFGETFNQDDTLFDWLGDVTNAVWHDERDSVRLDADMLGQLAKYRNASKFGMADAAIQTRRFRKHQVHVNEELAAKAEALVTDTPLSRRTRIKGVLNTIAYLDRGVLLNMEGGAHLRVLWNPEDLEPLRSLWGQAVLLEGLLQYKPNGKPLILVADAIRRANPQDALWKDLPRATSSKAGSGARKLNPGEVNPLFKLRGIFDGEIDEGRFAELVEALS